MPADYRGTYVSTAPDVTPAVIRAASLTIAHHALDTADARALLGALGLPGGEVERVVTVLACGHPSTEGYRHGRTGVKCRACIASRVPYLPPIPRLGCGTPAGYAVHRRAKEAACDPCLTAERLRTAAAREARQS